jgi:hypothetical protein
MAEERERLPKDSKGWHVHFEKGPRPEPKE